MKKLSFKKGTKNFNMVIEFNEEEKCYIAKTHSACCSDRTYIFPQEKVLNNSEKLFNIGKLLAIYDGMFQSLKDNKSFKDDKKFMFFVNKFTQEYYGYIKLDLIKEEETAKTLEQYYCNVSRMYSYVWTLG